VRVPLLEPVQFFGDAAPELLRLLHGFPVHVLVFLERLNVGLFREVRRTVELPVFMKDRINVDLGG
jgi:hypothetical protein